MEIPVTCGEEGE